MFYRDPDPYPGKWYGHGMWQYLVHVLATSKNDIYPDLHDEQEAGKHGPSVWVWYEA